MEFAIWAYPWDLVDEGSTEVAERLIDLGITEVNLATNYHHVQAFCPHNPERRTFFAKASSYFQPGNRYGKLRPIPNDSMANEDWLEQIADELEDVDIELNSWTVGVHNSRLGLEYPETTIENAFGDNLVFGLCPSNQDVQMYLEGLIGDLSDRGVFKRIGLETFDYFYGTGWGWHHDKFHTELGILGEFLFGLCFCPDCQKRAQERGVAVKQARSNVRTTIDAIVSGQLPSDANVTGWLRSHPDVASYIDVREDTLTELYSRLRQAAGSVELGYYAGFEESGRTWMQGADLTALADEVDYYMVGAYESSRKDAVNTYNEVKALTPKIPLHAGILPANPAVTDAETTCNIVTGLAEAGAHRISFYNYGLLPNQNLEWVGNAIEAVEG